MKLKIFKINTKSIFKFDISSADKYIYLLKTNPIWIHIMICLTIHYRQRMDPFNVKSINAYWLFRKAYLQFFVTIKGLKVGLFIYHVDFASFFNEKKNQMIFFVTQKIASSTLAHLFYIWYNQHTPIDKLANHNRSRHYQNVYFDVSNIFLDLSIWNC